MQRNFAQALQWPADMKLSIGRLPNPGEACQVHVQLLAHTLNRARFDFTLFGVDGDMLLNAKDYEVAWLSRDLNDQTDAISASVPS
jgi:hypothetical protein